MLQIQMRILRVFGLSKAEMTALTDAAAQAGCPSLRLQERDGEYLVCVQASAPTQAMADEYCERWVQKLRTRFGDACYGYEDTTLAQAALDALLKKRRLLVAADETTGRMLGDALRGLEHSEAAFDFGNQTYRNAANAARIGVPESLLKKFPGDLVQAAAGRAQSALTVANADYAAIYVPATVGQAPFVLLCSRIGAAACALGPGLSDRAVANNILDLARRRALGLHLGASAITFKPGHEHPLLLLSREGQPRPGSRFTLRRKPAPRPVEPPQETKPAAPPAPAPDAPPAEPPTGAITFEKTAPVQEAPPEPTAPRAPQDAGEDPFGLHTVGPEAAAAARARRRSQTQAPPLPGETRALNLRKSVARSPVQEKPAPADASPRPQGGSLLDGDIPDFAAALDPQEVEAARRADEKAQPRSVEEFQRAARQLFAGEDDEDPDEEWDEDPTIEFVGNPFSSRPKRAAEPPRPVRAEEPEEKETEEESPEGSPAPEPAAPAPEPQPEPPLRPKPRPAAGPSARNQAAIQKRSLAMIEQAERRRRRGAALAVLGAVAVVIALAAGLFWTLSRRSADAPDSADYGAETYAETVWNYVAAAEGEAVNGYLAFPAQNGQLMYTGSQPGDGAALVGTNYLNASMSANTVVSCADGSLAALTVQEGFAQNGEFTLYLDGQAYRCLTALVFYTDDAFNPKKYGDLSNYYDYTAFAQGARSRSLLDGGAAFGDDASFVTLMSTGGQNGAQICVLGVLQADAAQTQSETAPASAAG